MRSKFIFLSLFCLLSCTNVSGRQKAAQLNQDKKYEEAITEYKKHIEARLAVKDRPEWENPYIYYLDIGDIYLEQDDLEKAMSYYKLAEINGVKQDYVNDRFRQVANWYESKGELEKALKHLEQYQDRDPILFDLMLDRIARKIAEEQNSQL